MSGPPEKHGGTCPGIIAADRPTWRRLGDVVVVIYTCSECGGIYAMGRAAMVVGDAPIPVQRAVWPNHRGEHHAPAIY